MRSKFACMSISTTLLILALDCLFVSAQPMVTITRGELHAAANDGNFPEVSKKLTLRHFLHLPHLMLSMERLTVITLSIGQSPVTKSSVQ